MTGTITVRRLTFCESDLAAALEAECFTDAWSEESLRQEIDNRLTLYLGAWIDGKFAGYLGSRLVLDEGEIHRVAVYEEYRRLGIGRALINFLFEENPHIRSWNLEVREGNIPARKLYENFGFRPLGIRKNYYHDPVENCVNMQLLREE